MNLELFSLGSTAFILGFLGSYHCAFMCGPLAIAGCTEECSIKLKSTTGYFVGRLVSYMTVGALFAELGKHLFHVLPFFWIQTSISFFIALLLFWKGIRVLVAPATEQNLQSFSKQSWIPTWLNLPKRGLGLGLLTGVLPCGLFLPIWALAASTGNPIYGAFVMLVFSVATLPGLLLPLLGRKLFLRVFLRRSKTFYAITWFLVAFWLAVRPFLGELHTH